MNMDFINLILLGSFIVLVVLFYFKNKRRNFPPGPRGFPIIGNIHLINQVENFHEIFMKFAKEYGNVFYFKIGFGGGFFDSVVLNDIDSVEEAFVKNQNDFSGRPSSWFSDLFSMHGKDIVLADYGPEFKNRKNIASKGLRQFLSGKTLEKKVNNAVSLSLPHLEEYAAKTKPFDPLNDVTFIIHNVIAGMVFGKQYALDDEELKKIVSLNKESNENFVNVREVYLPRFVSTFWLSAGGKRAIEIVEEIFDYYRKSIKEHQEKFDPECPPQDIVDYLLLIQHENKSSESGEEIKKLDDVELLQLCNDLFLAGTDTSIATTTWIILFLAFHQDAQEKAFQEIKKVIGTVNDIQTTDQNRMPFCKAFQMESMRCGTVVPTGLPHKAICDTKLCGYDIPKNTAVIANHYALHHDPREWENPEEFKPERFLEQDGTIKAKPRSWLPFSAGRRACVGENIARAEIFIIWVSILQKFKILLPEGETPSLVQRLVPITPYPFNILLEVRD